MKPRMFIGSSVEQLELAYAAQEGLDYDVEAVVWDQGVFQLSKTAMASLIDALDASDFGLFVLAPDDISAIRDKTQNTVRDNVIFELGLFIGRLGPERCFMIVPRGSDDLHLPTDLTGLTLATFDADRQDKNLNAALGPACNRIRKAVRTLGASAQQSELPTSDAAVAASDLCGDSNDIITLIESWMGRRSSSDNHAAIIYGDVDRELKLVPGSAQIHIEQAAKRWGYVVARKGKDTILFEDGDSEI